MSRLATARTARGLSSWLGRLLGGLARCRPLYVFLSLLVLLVKHESRVDVWREKIIRWDRGVLLKVLDVLCIKVVAVVG